MNKLTKSLLVTGAALGGMALVNHRIAEGYRPGYSELDGEPDIYAWRDGIIYYHTKGQGEPVVLLHDFGITGGAYQMKPVYDALAEEYRVYAPEWLGYGQSNRPAIDHTAGAHEQSLGDFIGDVIGRPAVVVASGPGAAYAIRLAHRQPDKVSRLILVNPTGVDRLVESPAKWQLGLRLLFKLPIVGDFIFNLLASKPLLKWDLANRTFFDSALVTPAMLDYMWINAHQPGAKWGPISYWTGLLNLGIAHNLAAVSQPTMIIFGQQARKTPVEGIQGFKRHRPDARYRAFDRTGQWPQFENPRAFNALVRNWLQGKDTGAAAIFPGEVEPE